MGLEAFEEYGFQAESTYIAGGGSKSPIWRQITADILGIPVMLPAVEETAAFGGALQALWAKQCSETGYIDYPEIFARYTPESRTPAVSPREENRDVYEKRYAEYKQYVEALSGLFQ